MIPRMSFARRPRAALLALGLAALPLAAAPALAQTTLSGHHDNNAGGDGYDEAATGDYVSPAGATFSGNLINGLLAQTSGTTTVRGGVFDNNTGSLNANRSAAGLSAMNTTVVVNDGDFSYNGGTSPGGYGLLAVNSTVTINGGTFNDPLGYDVSAQHSTLTINGGQFAGSPYFYEPDAIIVDLSTQLTINGGQFQGGVLTGSNQAPFDTLGSDTITGGAFRGGSVYLSNRYVTVTGGSFSDQFGRGLQMQIYDGPFSSGGRGLITGGSATGSNTGLTISSNVTITGGQFTKNFVGVDVNGSNDAIYGGLFANNTVDLFVRSSSSVTVYGTFDHYGVLTGDANGNGAFTGTLEDDTAPQTITYTVQGGTLILAPAPEPSALAGLGVGLLGLAGLGWKARRRA